MSFEVVILTTMDPFSVAVSFAAVVIVYWVYRRYTRISLADIPGPEPASFLMGNTKELYQSQVAEADFKWQAQYGNIVRFKGPLGEDQLMINDPTALQHIFVKSHSRFPKAPERIAVPVMLNGKGIAWVHGEVHKRYKKVMLPGFGAQESKALLPTFQGCAESLSNKWMDILSNTNEQSAVLDIAAWLSRAALDTIGEAAFDVRFGCIDNKESALARAYNNMMPAIYGSPSDGQIFLLWFSRYIPTRILEYLRAKSKDPRMVRVREVASLATSLAKQLVEEKAEVLLQGKGNRDLFSLLVKANMDADAKVKLTEKELIAQMRTILFAGKETTSTTLSWALLELAKHPEIQSRLREEIRETEAAIHTRGEASFTNADFDNMPYTTAVIKEVLRFCPAAYHIYRYASQDDVLPLSKPITTRIGKVIHELLVPKGTRIVISIAAYNRNKDLWGDDAHVFNPERWLNGAANEKNATSIGVYSNLMTFIGGNRACIGWRFAVIQIQAFLVEVVGKFEFVLTDKAKRIRREACLAMAPTVEGEVENGIQLPLKVSVAPCTEKGY